VTIEEKALLLTVGRILRARISETRIGSNDDDDLWALDEALKPFEASQAPAPNEQNAL